MTSSLRWEAHRQKWLVVARAVTTLFRNVLEVPLERAALVFEPGDRNWDRALRVTEQRQVHYDMSRAESIRLRPYPSKGGSDERGALSWRIEISGRFGGCCGSEWYVGREHVFRRWAGDACDCFLCVEKESR
jgi:hypothetical protein